MHDNILHISVNKKPKKEKDKKMAINCIPTITVVDIPAKIVKIMCVVSVDAGIAHTVVLEHADISTVAKKTVVANTIWNKFLALRAIQLQKEGVAGELASLETALKTNIEGRTI